jgi:filamentous hemagglutinin
MSDYITPKGRVLTVHAQESLLRHDLLEPFDLIDDIIDNSSRRTTQSDGATVYIQRTQGRVRKYNIVIEGEEGIVLGC